MKFQKSISILLHPIVIPTIGSLLYFLLIPHRIHKSQQFIVLGVIFIATYLTPLLVLLVLKSIKTIHSFELSTIKERKIPLFLMVLLFLFLGGKLSEISILRDFGILFSGASYALIVVYFLFILRIKTSLHLLSMGMILGFFLVLAILYSISLLPLIILFILLSGILASVRLILKAHTPKEVYLGFFLGITSQFLAFYFELM